MYDFDVSFLFFIDPVSDQQIIELFILAAVCTIFVYFYRHIASIYNMNFEGQLCLVGYGYIKKTSYGYSLHMSNSIKQRSLTRHYKVLLNELHTGRDEGMEVYFYLGNKVCTAELEEEMEVVF